MALRSHVKWPTYKLAHFNQYERDRVFGELNEAAGAIDF